MYRINLSNKKDKEDLLMNANKLKDHPTYGGVYIARDLTYKQRQENIEKRARARSERVRGQNHGANLQVTLTGSNSVQPI